MSSVFSQIMAGTIPSHLVYADEYAYAFMDIHPIQPGHVLDVPHVHVKVFPIDSGEQLRHTPDSQADPDHAALATLAQRLAQE